jgi:hypothetical protein
MTKPLDPSSLAPLRDYQPQARVGERFVSFHRTALWMSEVVPVSRSSVRSPWANVVSYVMGEIGLSIWQSHALPRNEAYFPI